MKVYYTCNLFNWVPNVDFEFEITNFQAIIGLIGAFEGASVDIFVISLTPSFTI